MEESFKAEPVKMCKYSRGYYAEIQEFIDAIDAMGRPGNKLVSLCQRPQCPHQVDFVLFFFSLETPSPGGWKMQILSATTWEVAHPGYFLQSRQPDFVQQDIQGNREREMLLEQLWKYRAPAICLDMIDTLSKQPNFCILFHPCTSFSLTKVWQSSVKVFPLVSGSKSQKRKAATAQTPPKTIIVIFQCFCIFVAIAQTPPGTNILYLRKWVNEWLQH